MRQILKGAVRSGWGTHGHRSIVNPIPSKMKGIGDTCASTGKDCLYYT